MASAEQRTDSPARDQGFDAFAFAGRSDGSGSPILDLPGFDGSRERRGDKVHYKVVMPNPENPLAQHNTAKIEAAFAQLRDVTWEFVPRD